jgi:hypothetical protein
MYCGSGAHAGKERRGASAVELGIVLPGIVFLVVAALGLARAYCHSAVASICTQRGPACARDPLVAARSLYTDIRQALSDASDLKPVPAVSTACDTDPYVEGTSDPFTTVMGYLGVSSGTTSHTVESLAARGPEQPFPPSLPPSVQGVGCEGGLR